MNALEARFCRRCETPLPAPEPELPPRTHTAAPAPDPAPVTGGPRGQSLGSSLAGVLALLDRVQLGWARRKRRHWGPVVGDPRRLAGVGLLVGASALIVVIAVLDTSGGSRQPTPRPASPPAPRPALRAEAPVRHASPQPVQRHPLKRPPAKPASAPAAVGPVSVVADYWHSISRHAFATAYAKVAPGSIDLSPSAFATYERQIGVSSVQFAGRAAWRSPTEAGVAVEQLVTRDTRFGCRSWSGEYVVRTAGGRWQIERAAIAPHPCTG